jgi:hypothetical protein
MPVVRLEKTFKVKPVVKILPEIKDLFRIRNLQRELARDLGYSQVGYDVPMSGRVRHLARLQIDFEQKYGHAADTRKLS